MALTTPLPISAYPEPTPRPSRPQRYKDYTGFKLFVGSLFSKEFYERCHQYEDYVEYTTTLHQFMVCTRFRNSRYDGRSRYTNNSRMIIELLLRGGAKIW